MLMAGCPRYRATGLVEISVILSFATSLQHSAVSVAIFDVAEIRFRVLGMTLMNHYYHYYCVFAAIVARSIFVLIHGALAAKSRAATDC